MDRGAVLLQGLRSKLQPWFVYIQRCTHATNVRFSEGVAGEFAVVVSGVAKDQSPWSFSTAFTREKCFGPTFGLDPAAWCIPTRPCDYARAIVREVLQQRGVL